MLGLIVDLFSILFRDRLKGPSTPDELRAHALLARASCTRRTVVPVAGALLYLTKDKPGSLPTGVVVR